MVSSRSTTASAISKAIACLRLFAQALKDSCREYDYVARMGGDEFVVIAPGLASDTAGKKAEQMRALARQAGSEVCGEEILSLSVGRALCIRMTARMRNNYWPKPIAGCISKSRSSFPTRIGGRIRALSAG